MTVPQVIEIFVPQMGEGLREVRILSLLRQVGDVVKRDDVLYSMETDKANVDVESPEDGVLAEWLVTEGDVIPVGAPIARFSPVDVPAPEAVQRNGHVVVTRDGASESLSSGGAAVNAFAIAFPGATGGHLPAVPGGVAAGAPSVPARVPPRTAAYCRQHGISEEVVRQIPARGSSLTVQDVDDFLNAASTDDASGSGFRDLALSESQANLKFHLERSHVSMVPAIVKTVVPWALIESARARVRASEAAVDLSHFQVFAYCVARATAEHPKFRSRLLEKNVVRQYDHVNLGFAVALPNDDLVTAVVRDADTVELAQFGRAMMRQLREARRGRDQAAQDTQMTLSHMPDQDVIDGIPVLVSPMVATLFLGTHHRAGDEDVVNLVLCFDHRLINGVGAGKFLKTVAENLKRVGG